MIVTERIAKEPNIGDLIFCKDYGWRMIIQNDSTKEKCLIDLKGNIVRSIPMDKKFKDFYVIEKVAKNSEINLIIKG